MMTNASLHFPAFAEAPSTFIAMHPLHCGSAVFRQQQPSPIRTRTLRALALSPSKAASSTTMTMKIRKSCVVFDFTTEEMAKYFHMSQREAAQQLGVATVTIKRNCRRLGIVWPYRIMKSKQHANTGSVISREDAKRIRLERTLERAKADRSPSGRSCSRSLSHRPANTEDPVDTSTQRSNSNGIELTEAGRAFARLPLDSIGTSD